MLSMRSAAFRVGGGLSSIHSTTKISTETHFFSRLPALLASNSFSTLSWNRVPSSNPRNSLSSLTPFLFPIRPFSSSSSLLSYDQRKGPSRWETFSRKYEPEIERVIRRIDYFNRYPFINGVTNGQILLLVFLLSIFIPISNYFNFLFLIVIMVVNMMT